MHGDGCSGPLHEELRRAYNAAVVASSAGHWGYKNAFGASESLGASNKALLTAPCSVPLVDFGKGKALSAEKLDAKEHLMDDNDRIAEQQQAREKETARPQSTDEAVQGRMARLDVSQELARHLLDLETRIWQLEMEFEELKRRSNQ